MPRIGALLSLSREHHSSLVMARTARRAVNENENDVMARSVAMTAAMASIEAHWHTLMAAHFEREERLIRIAQDALDPQAFEAALNRMTTKPAVMLGALIPRFSAERFLYDYAEDGKLWMRLNAVMRRVQLAELPAGFESVLAIARAKVRPRVAELLTPSP